MYIILPSRFVAFRCQHRGQSPRQATDPSGVCTPDARGESEPPAPPRASRARQDAVQFAREPANSRQAPECRLERQTLFCRERTVRLAGSCVVRVRGAGQCRECAGEGSDCGAAGCVCIGLERRSVIPPVGERGAEGSCWDSL